MLLSYVVNIRLDVATRLLISLIFSFISVTAILSLQ